MGPEINGNPPSATKRKKNREKKSSMTGKSHTLDFNMSNCNYFPTGNPQAYQNISIPDITTYYSFLNYSNSNEPMSLPVYPMNYPNYYPSNPNLNFPPKPMMPTNPDEYLSLPVRNLDQNDDESKRRFSDPGLPNDSSDSSGGIENKIIQKLTQQISVLKENNRKLSREVMEMRMELNLLKQQNSRHYDREYEPGMLADIIREVRDAARVREDALLARVKHMIEEKQLSMNHMHLVTEKKRNNDRISKLEEQLKNLSVSSSKSDENISNGMENGNNSARQVFELEREALELRRELQDTRAKKEEADQKLLQLDKKLSSILRRNDMCTSDMSEDGKTTSIDSSSIITTSSVSQPVPVQSRVIMTGPVTDL